MHIKSLIFTAMLSCALLSSASAAVIFSSAPGNTLVLEITADIHFVSTVSVTTNSGSPNSYIGVLFPNVYSSDIFYVPNNGEPVVTQFGQPIPLMTIDGLNNAQTSIFYGQSFGIVDRNDLAIYFESYPANVTITPGETVTLPMGVYSIPGFFNEGTMPDQAADCVQLLHSRGFAASDPACIPESSPGFAGLLGILGLFICRPRKAK